MLIGFIFSLFNIIQRIFVLLFLDPINVFCLFFLFLGTLGYVLILRLIRTVSRRNISRKTRVNSRESMEAELKHEKLPIISFIIPVYNEENTIEKKLKNTFELNYPKDLLEVIVVDDGSTDKTPIILEAIHGSWFPELKVVRQNRRGKSSAENLGLQNSKGHIFVISDADVPLNRDALRFMIEDFEDSKVGGVTCTIEANKKYVLALNLDLSLYVRKLENEIDSVFGMSGPLVSSRRAVVPKIDEGIFSSDADLGIVVRKNGYKVVYDSRIRSHVDQWVEGRPKTVVGELRKLRHLSFGNITLFMRHKDVLFRKSYGLFGWVIAPRYLLFITLAPIIFVLLSMNSVVKLIESNLLVPFSFLIMLFLFITFLSRKIASESFISRTLYLIFMYVLGYYAQFFYYLLFISKSSHRRGIWEQH